MHVRRIPGVAVFLANYFPGTLFQLQGIKSAAKRCLLFVTLFSLWAMGAWAQDSAPPPDAQSQEPGTPGQGVLPASTTAPPEAPLLLSQPVLPAKPHAHPSPFARAPWPAALAPAIEARVGFSTLSRVSSPNNRIFFKGINASVTAQSSEHFGATFETSLLRASNVFSTGQSNSILTFLGGPVFYPYRRNSFVTSVRVLGGSARVSGVVVLTPSNGGFLKGTADDLAWAFGTGLEKWFTESLAARVDIDALHTSFYNSSVKVHGEYDLRATWGLIYYFGGRKGGKFRSFVGRQIE
jgi:hypothetical protein